MTRASVCKFCGSEFEQPRVQGRPLEFCKPECRIGEKRFQRTRLTNARYAALRKAGVSATAAQPASCSKHRFEAMMKEAANAQAS